MVGGGGVFTNFVFKIAHFRLVCLSYTKETFHPPSELEEVDFCCPKLRIRSRHEGRMAGVALSTCTSSLLHKILTK